MKRLLMKSKSEPVNCSFGQGEDKTMALLMLDKVKGPKAVEKDLTKKFPTANNTRFGTAEVDVDIDPKLVRFRINKTTSGAARKLVKTLKGTGFSKVEIVLEDGTLVERGAEEEEEGVEVSSSEGTAPTPPTAPPPPGLDPNALTAQLTVLVKRMMGIIGTTPTAKDTLAPMAAQAQGSIKSGALDVAATQIAAFAKALDGFSGNGTGTATAPQSPTAPPPQNTGKVAYAKSRLAWLAARKKIEGDIEKLRAEVVASFEEDGSGPELDKLYRDRVGPVLNRLDESLADKLDDAANAADPAQRQKLIGEARTIIDGYTSYVNGEPLLDDLDNNPFVPVAIKATLTATLSALSKTIV
jgi:hypothetical protein